MYKLFVVSVLAFIVACSSSESHRDLQEFIDENKKRPPGTIKDAPKIEPYESFTYDAYRLRSPFDQPVSASLQRKIIASSSNVKPDANRKKERLEQFDLSSIKMVGTLTKGGALWALVSDPDGSIERVRRGSFLGRNHGKITKLAEDKIELLEIVASGDGWLERPNILQLQTTDEN